MAAPRNNSYAAPSGGGVYAGVDAPSSIPSWRTAQAADTWAAIPLAAQLAALNPRLDPALNPNYPTTWPEYMNSEYASWGTLAAAWNGGCYDRGRDEFLIPLTGGHADYAGNDFLALCLRHEVPYWERRGKPSGWDGSVITNDQPRLQPGSSGSTVYLAKGSNAPVIYGGTDAASSVNDAYNGMTLAVYAQSNRTITDYDGATGMATVTPAFGGSVAGLTYVVQNGPTVHGALGEQTGRYSDGRARAVHTYNIPEFADLDDAPWMAVGGSGPSWTASQGYYNGLRVDRETGEHTFDAGPGSAIAASPLGAGVTYDPTRGVKGSLWYFGQGGSYFGRLDCNSRTWSQSAAFSPRGGQQSLVYLPGHDLILITNNSGQWALYDPVANTLTAISVSGTPAGGATDFGSAQLCYVEADNSVYWWNNPTGSTVAINKMTVPANPKTGAWTITQTTPAGSNAVTPTARQSNGTFGRFRYSSFLDGFVLWNSVDGPVYFYARA